MSDQFPLNLEHVPSFASEDLLTLSCNVEAVQILQSWPDWPSHALALIGPKGAGKSHLGHAWGAQVGAIDLTPSFDITTLSEGSNVLVDDADSGIYNEDMLFHLYNWTKETGGTILFTGNVAPNNWVIKLPDLKSRLATIYVTSIGVPDEEALMMILAKLLSDRQLIYGENLLDYLVTRMERSFEFANRVAAELDQMALAKKRRITRNLAREVLEKLDSE